MHMPPVVNPVATATEIIADIADIRATQDVRATPGIRATTAIKTIFALAGSVTIRVIMVIIKPALAAVALRTMKPLWTCSMSFLV